MNAEQARKLVEQHLKNKGKQYLDLLATTKKAVDAAAERLGEGIVIRSHSRGRSQTFEQGDLKDVTAIVNTLRERHSRDPNFSLNDMNDIASLTVVVAYNDQLKAFIDAFVSIISNFKLHIIPTAVDKTTEVVRKNGAYATHMMIRGNTPATAIIRLELRVTTVLHDAWADKVRDSVYRVPRGADPRLRELLESFGDSLQAIEVQSEALRDTFMNKIRLLRQLRQNARVSLMHRLHQQKIADKDANKAFRSVFRNIEKQKPHLTTCISDDEKLLALLSDIADLKKVGVDPYIRLKLTVFLASLRDGTDLASVVDAAIDEYQQTGKNDGAFVWVRSSALHQTNRIKEAIDLLRSSLAISADDSALELRLNLANYLIEAALDEQDPSDKNEVDELIQLIEASPDKDRHKAAFKSLKAARLIVFGNELELGEGLDLCIEARSEVELYGKNYCELYLNYGWQRKLQA